MKGEGEVERKGILGQGRFAAGEGEGEAGGFGDGLFGGLPGEIAGKTVLLEVIGLAVEVVLVVRQIAADGKQNGNAPAHREAWVGEAIAVKVENILTLNLPLGN